VQQIACCSQPKHDSRFLKKLLKSIFVLFLIRKDVK